LRHESRFFMGDFPRPGRVGLIPAPRQLRAASASMAWAQVKLIWAATGFDRVNIPNRDYRVYFYDCKPCSERTSFPISHTSCNFETSPRYIKGMKLIKEIE
jgi:hypothetical protein